jgi:hypothetical protein
MSLDPTSHEAMLTCEFYVGEELHVGPVRDVSAAGFFVETDVAIDPPTEVELRLVGRAAPETLYMRAVVEQRVVRKSSTPEAVTGVRFRILQLPRQYGALIGAPNVTQPGEEQPAMAARRRSDLDEREWVRGFSDTPRPTRVGDGIDRSRWKNEIPLFERAGQPLWSDTPAVPEALVIDDGELDDVVSMLGELGTEPCRESPDHSFSLVTWVPPSRVLVVTARRPLLLRLSLHSQPEDLVGIAVTDSDARTVSAAMYRLGYRYVIRRPVHPMALKALLRKAIGQDAGKRRAPRETFGCEVSWRVGWRRRSGAMIDISSRGCQLLARKRADLGSRVKIRIPSEVAEGPAFTVAGRIARCALATGNGALLGVEFEKLSARIEERIRRVVAAREHGPVRLEAAPAAPKAGMGLGPSQGAARAGCEDRSWAGSANRRRKPRVPIQQEVVALDLQAAEVKHLLVGCDLSPDGIRVEAHPALTIDERLRIALFDTADAEPLTLYALVARDDGPRGWWLRFVGLDQESRARLKRAIEGPPSLEFLEDLEPVATWAMLGQVLLATGEI